MKRVNNLYPILISDENLKMAIWEVNKTHKWRSHHKPNKVVLWIESDIEQRALDLRNISNLFRLKRQLASYYKKVARHIKIPYTMELGLLSRLGQLRHCNSKHIYSMYVKPKTQRGLKNIVRAYARKERAKWNTSSALLNATA